MHDFLCITDKAILDGKGVSSGGVAILVSPGFSYGARVAPWAAIFEIFVSNC